jgi:hypothetical protein
MALVEGALVEGVKVHTQGRLRNAPNTAVDGDFFSFKGGSTGCVMIMEPITPFLNYYEYEITARGVEASIGIGVGERNYPLNRMPGWNRNSVGYHGDDGKLYHENGRGDRFGPTCTEGDKMGCGIDFDAEVDYGYHEVFFTKNGQPVGNVVRMKRPVHGLYPIIGLHSAGEKVRYLGHWHRQRQSLLEPMVLDHSPSNVWLRSNGITFTGNGLTLEYCGTGGASQDVSLAQACYPLDRTNHYFELEILNGGSLGAIAIGVGRSSYPLHSHPGWSVGSVGYHADDGKLFVEIGRGQEFGPSCAEGDRMGCGLLFDSPDGMEAQGEGRAVGGMGDDSGEDEGEGSLLSLGDSDDDYVSIGDDDDDDDDDAMLYRHLFGRGGRMGRGLGGHRQFHDNFDRGLFGGFGGRRGRGGNFARGVRLNDPFAPLMSAAKESIKANSGCKCKVFFTKNGEKVGDVDVCIPKGGFFPLVGLLSKGEKVRVDLQPLTG